MGQNFGNVYFHPEPTEYPAQVMPLWLEVKERKIAGGTVHLEGLPVGTIIPAALPVSLPKMGGNATFLDTYEVLEDVTAESTSIKLKGTNNTAPFEGLILSALNASNKATKAAALGAKNEDGSFAITANALGALTAGTKLYVAAEAGSSKNLLMPDGLAWRQIVVTNKGAYSGTVAVVTKGQILADRMPELPEVYKDALPGITFEHEL